MHSAAAALPPTANTLSSRERSALVRSSRKLTKVLGDVPRVPEDDIPSVLELTLTRTATSTHAANSESAWRKRKPTHLPPLLKLSAGNPSVDSLPSTTTPVYHRLPPSHRTSVLSVVSNTPSTTSTASFPSETSSERRAKLERLRRKLGNEVPATAVFATTPRTPTPSTPSTSSSFRHPATPRARTRSFVRPRGRPAAPAAAAVVAVAGDDSRSITFSINSDESTHTVTFAAARVQHTPPRPRKSKHVYQTGPLPPVPPLPAHLTSSAPRNNDDHDVDAGLVRPRQKMAAGSRLGGADFKAARRAKREGRSMGEPGEFVEMVGFMF